MDDLDSNDILVLLMTITFYNVNIYVHVSTMLSTWEIRNVLKDCLPEIRENFGVVSIGIFGSYARGDMNPNSDIDIIVELSRPLGWELVDLSLYLESRLLINVDLVIKRSLHPLIRDAILKEVQYV